MKIITIAMALLISMALADPAAAAGKKIRKEADFNAQVVGKTLVYPGGGTIAVGPGTLTGKASNGDKIVGAWNWQGRYFCRNVRVGANTLPTDCQAVEIDGTTISFIRNKGKGESSVATLR